MLQTEGFVRWVVVVRRAGVVHSVKLVHGWVRWCRVFRIWRQATQKESHRQHRARERSTTLGVRRKGHS